MKTKIIILIIAFIGFSSCIKDYHGGGPEEIKFTEKNYIYEGALYTIYLDNEIEALDIKIQFLKEKLALNPQDEKIEKELFEATELRDNFDAELNSIVSLEQVGLKLPPPPPPCPRPRNCDFTGLEYLLTGIGVEKIQILFLNEDGNVIGGGTIDELSPLPEGEGQINYSNITIGNQNGTVSAIQVQVINSDGIEERNYTVK